MYNKNNKEKGNLRKKINIKKDALISGDNESVRKEVRKTAQFPHKKHKSFEKEERLKKLKEEKGRAVPVESFDEKPVKAKERHVRRGRLSNSSHHMLASKFHIILAASSAVLLFIVFAVTIFPKHKEENATITPLEFSNSDRSENSYSEPGSPKTTNLGEEVQNPIQTRQETHEEQNTQKRPHDNEVKLPKSGIDYQKQRDSLYKVEQGNTVPNSQYNGYQKRRDDSLPASHDKKEDNEFEIKDNKNNHESSENSTYKQTPSDPQPEKQDNNENIIEIKEEPKNPGIGKSKKTSTEGKKNKLVRIDGKEMTVQDARANGYVEYQGKWMTREESISIRMEDKRKATKALEERRNTEEFMSKVFGGKPKKLGKNKWKLYYDFSKEMELGPWIYVQTGDVQKSENIKSHLTNGYLEIVVPKGIAFAYLNVLFKGDITITYKGATVSPCLHDVDVWVYDAEERKGNGYFFAMAWEETPNVFYNGIQVYQEKNSRLITRSSKPKIVPDQWYTGKIDIKGPYLELSINNDPIGNSKKHDKFRSGIIGFGTFSSKVRFDDITIIGQVDERWLSKSMKTVEASDRIVQEIKKIGSDYEEEFEEPQLDEKTFVSTALELISLANTEAVESWRIGIQNYLANKYEASIEAFSNSIKQDPRFALSYLFRGVVYSSINNTDKAILDLSKSIELYPKLKEAFLYRGVVYLVNEENDKAINDFRSAVDISPDYTLGYIWLAKSYIATGNLKKATEIAEVALNKNPDDKMAQRFQKTLTILTEGPSWDYSYEKETQYFSIVTNVSQKFCDKLALYLELMSKTYLSIYPSESIKKDEQKSKVIIFESKGEFMEYSLLTGRGLKPTTAGYFSPITKEIVLYDDIESKNTIETMIHESSHRFLHKALSNVKRIPMWFNEGLAMYFQTSQVQSDGTIKIGKLDRYMLSQAKTLIREQYVPLSKLVCLTHEEFYDPKTIYNNYTQAWSFVYFLINGGGGAYKPLLRNYFKALSEGNDINKAYESVFSKINWNKLEKEWKSYIDTLQD